MAPVWAKITTARELLFEKEQTPALRVIFRNFVSLPARGRQLGAHSGRPEWILKVLETRRSLQKQKFVIFEIPKRSRFVRQIFRFFQMLGCIPWSSRIFPEDLVSQIKATRFLHNAEIPESNLIDGNNQFFKQQEIFANE